MAKQYGRPNLKNKTADTPAPSVRAPKQSAPKKMAKKPVNAKRPPSHAVSSSEAGLENFETKPSDPTAKILNMADDERRIFVLKRIASNSGKLEPTWYGAEDKGFAYFTTQNRELNQKLHNDLNFLSSRDYLEKEFCDRITRCPSCSSHQINMREICVVCGSSHLVSQPLFHHFRCGYVGPVEMFETDNRGRHTCPKCNRKLENLGTDHEIPGDHFSCRNCFASFQDPAVEGLCLSCSRKTPADQLGVEDVFSFKISRLGSSAIRSNRLFSDESEQLQEAALPLYRKTIFLSLIDDNYRRFQRYEIDFSLVFYVAHYSVRGDERDKVEANFIKNIHSQLREVDRLGRFSEDAYIAYLPVTPAAGAEIVLHRSKNRTRIDGVDFNGQIIGVNKTTDLQIEYKKAYEALKKSLNSPIASDD